MIKWLKKRQSFGQPIRECGPESHLLTKKGTPTMGGVIILMALTLSTLCWMNLNNPFVWIVLIMTLGFGVLGAFDDYLKLIKRSHAGLSASKKLFGQIVLSIIGTYLIQKYTNQDLKTILTFPFLKNSFLDLGVFFPLWGSFVIVGSSNAVNLTDGLDGLAIVPAMLSALCLGIIAYCVGNSVFSNYLQLSHIQDCGELSIFVGAFIGSGLGFLWFNAPPARVFMGDTGSLAAGASLGTISVITKHEFIWSIIGGIFVIEAVSVILQVGYYKLTKKRIFLMAPIHHHFEKKGWPESTIVIRFWIIASVLALIGLSSLKIR
jgi:phospho-N-acetylmuramoyl-pentapeptide-transferase